MVQVKKNIILGIMYSDYDGIFTFRPFTHKYTYDAYRKFSLICRDYSIKAIFANPRWYNNKKFLIYWDLLSNKTGKNAPVDLIFDRCVSLNSGHYAFMEKLRKRIVKQMPIINNPFVESACNDKFMTYKLFGNHSPKTFFSVRQISKIKSEQVVIKPRFGSGGRGIKIVNKNSVRRLSKDYMLQEFIDTSYGIKGEFRGVHDLRLVILDGKIIDFYVRSPKQGLLSNISLGGRLFRIKRCPAKVGHIARIIDKRLINYKPRFYSIDFLIDKAQVPWVVELNSCPTLDAYCQFKGQAKIYAGICRNIAKVIRLSQK